VYQVTIHTRDSEPAYVVCFDDARTAHAFCFEEVKWELTARVVCPALSFDAPGDFA
jgi:hypothetical protein